MKIKELRQLKEENLQEKLVELSREIVKLRAQVATGAAPKTAGQIRRARKTTARIKTLLNEGRTKNKA